MDSNTAMAQFLGGFVLFVPYVAAYAGVCGMTVSLAARISARRFQAALESLLMSL